MAVVIVQLSSKVHAISCTLLSDASSWLQRPSWLQLGRCSQPRHTNSLLHPGAQATSTSHCCMHQTTPIHGHTHHSIGASTWRMRPNGIRPRGRHVRGHSHHMYSPSRQTGSIGAVQAYLHGADNRNMPRQTEIDAKDQDMPSGAATALLRHRHTLIHMPRRMQTEQRPASM
jgi:hypothetical protein